MDFASFEMVCDGLLAMVRRDFAPLDGDTFAEEFRDVVRVAVTSFRQLFVAFGRDLSARMMDFASFQMVCADALRATDRFANDRARVSSVNLRCAPRHTFT